MVIIFAIMIGCTRHLPRCTGDNSGCQSLPDVSRPTNRANRHEQHNTYSRTCFCLCLFYKSRRHVPAMSNRIGGNSMACALHTWVLSISFFRDFSRKPKRSRLIKWLQLEPPDLAPPGVPDLGPWDDREGTGGRHGSDSRHGNPVTPHAQPPWEPPQI